MEVVAVDVVEESTAGICTVGESLPVVLQSPQPATTPLLIKYDNTIGQLQLGGTARCVLNVHWAALDGTRTTVEATVRITAVENQPFDLQSDSDWSIEGIYPGADVTISQNARITLSDDAEVSSLNVAGTLVLEHGSRLVVTDNFTAGASGTIIVNGGRLEILNDASQINGVIQLNAGEVDRNMG